jgi:4-alpha-glucanotransferase
VNADAHWNKIGKRTHQGICVPLFSLHTKTSCGIGEFFDLVPLIDWASSLKLDVIQLLPIFDTGEDPSPYNPVSSCALDPVYLKLTKLPNPLPLDPFVPLKGQNRVDRKTVKEEKLSWLYRYFQTHFQPKESGYLHFIHSSPWIDAYTQYKANRDHTSPEFHSYLQYLCFLQLRQVHTYASSKGVFLKGDIPYLLNGGSVDVLENPHLFNRNLEAGAPPDYYNPNGQNWGCPLFNWDVMHQEKFRWWKRRMEAIHPYFDMYRLDHVVGLFRIWGIEPGKLATEGHFVPDDESLWLSHGKEILAMLLNSSPLLPIAEDLGTIPSMVRPCLKELGICSTKVIRWERNWNGDRRFIPFDQYEPISMTTCSTMDSDTLKGWWEKNPEESAEFADFLGWRFEPRLSFEHQKAILHHSYHTASLFHINMLQDVLALFPELVGSVDEERINVPGTLLPTNWSYRLKPSVEELASHPGLRMAMQEILE